MPFRQDWSPQATLSLIIWPDHCATDVTHKVGEEILAISYGLNHPLLRLLNGKWSQISYVIPKERNLTEKCRQPGNVLDNAR